MNPYGLLFVAAGGFTIAGAVRNWDWFMNARKARFMVALLTRNGARLFYGAVVLALSVFGFLAATGIIDISQ